MEYVYPVLGILVTIYTIVFAFRTSHGFVATVYGLFKYTCNITLIFGVIGIVISIVCVVCFGMPFVMVGLLFNEIGCSIATLFILKKEISWFKIKQLIVRSFIMVVLVALSYILYIALEPNITSWLQWAVYGLIIAFATLSIIVVYCLIFEKKQVKMLARYVRYLFIKKNRF